MDLSSVRISTKNVPENLRLRQKFMRKFRKQTVKYRLKQAKILDIIVDSTSKTRVLSQVREKITKKHKFYIVTPNPEMVMRARYDKLFRKILNGADIKLPDGIGLAAAHRFLSLPGPQNRLIRLLVVSLQGVAVGFSVFINRKWLFENLEIIKGREFFLDLAKLANKRGWKVFLFGGENGVCEETAAILSRSLKKVKIEYSQGPIIDKFGKPVSAVDKRTEKEMVQQINRLKPHLLFVALGAPKQEKWLYRQLPNLDIGGAMVVGGTFNYVSGKVSLPPKWINNIGLEWLWRLFTQPKRIGRIVMATIAFPAQVFWYKLTRS